MSTDRMDVDTGHLYDGIREYDNPLPRWWLVTLFGAIVFAMFYWFFYQSIGNLPDSRESYEAARAQWEKQMLAASVKPEELAAHIQDPEAIARGKEIFLANCASCHMPDARGAAGPNLTDAYWLHGGKPMDLYKTISLGVRGKTMAAWRPVIGDAKVRDAVAFLSSIRNTNVKGKPPEGVDAQGNKP